MRINVLNLPYLCFSESCRNHAVVFISPYVLGFVGETDQMTARVLFPVRRGTLKQTGVFYVLGSQYFHLEAREAFCHTCLPGRSSLSCREELILLDS